MAVERKPANRYTHPRETPGYALTEAAHYLGMPRSTLRSWFLGQRGETADFRPVLALPDRRRPILSFVNLVEAHLLDGLRRHHHIPLQRLRRALAYLSKQSFGPHPLASHRFETDGLDLFVERYGSLVNASRDGQLAMRAVLQKYLHRIDWNDKTGVAERLYPFTRLGAPDEPRAVVIDPRVAFGRPVLAGTGIPTAVIASRLKAGESIRELAKDYNRGVLEIEEAIRCEIRAA